MKLERRIIYSWSFCKIIDGLIPEEIRNSLSDFGWNVLGVYEAVENAKKIAKLKGIKIKMTRKEMLS